MKVKINIPYLLLYSSLSLFTLASTLYRALISGVMVSIWTPTPSGCVQETPGPVTHDSLPVPNRRVWLKDQIVPGRKRGGGGRTLLVLVPVWQASFSLMLVGGDGSVGLRAGLMEKPDVVRLEFESVVIGLRLFPSRYLLSNRGGGFRVGERRPPGM